MLHPRYNNMREVDPALLAEEPMEIPKKKGQKMGKIQKMAELVEEFRKIVYDYMAEAPRELWKYIMDVDELIDLVKYRVERLEEKLVEINMRD